MNDVEKVEVFEDHVQPLSPQICSLKLNYKSIISISDSPTFKITVSSLNKNNLTGIMMFFNICFKSVK